MKRLQQISTVIVTCDREENYLDQTLQSLKKHEHYFILSQGSQSTKNLALSDISEIQLDIDYYLPKEEETKIAPDDVRTKAQYNYINALMLSTGYPYKLILEDDVIASDYLNMMLQTYIKQVEEKEKGGAFILSLYTPYIDPTAIGYEPNKAYEINIDEFYGLQACLYSDSITNDFAVYISEHLSEQPHDFLIKDYCKARGIKIYGAGASLFQHIGKKTTGLGYHHTANNFWDDIKHKPIISASDKKANHLSFSLQGDKQTILVSSEHLANTGFATVSKNITKSLKDSGKFEVCVVDIMSELKSAVDIDGIQVIGNKNQSDTFSIERIIDNIEHFDFLFVINDIWNINLILDKLRQSGKKLPKIFIYFPVDAENHSPYWYQHLDIVTQAYTYTSYAYKVVKGAIKQMPLTIEAAEDILNKIAIVPHGYDANSFYNIQERDGISINEIRERLFKTDKFNDAFILLNANTNQPRKRLDITMRAFAWFLKRLNEQNIFLYMHSAIEGCINILELARQLNIEHNLILSTPIDKPKERPNASIEEMNLIFNACDVGINTSMGEGWGLCSMEHMITGAPQIVPAHSACEEIFFNVKNPINYGIISVQEFMFDHIMTIGYIPDTEDASSNIEEAFLTWKKNNRRISPDLNESKLFSWQQVGDIWVSEFTKPLQ